jgi:hypothetical protein
MRDDFTTASTLGDSDQVFVLHCSSKRSPSLILAKLARRTRMRAKTAIHYLFKVIPLMLKQRNSCLIMVSCAQARGLVGCRTVRKPSMRCGTEHLIPPERGTTILLITTSLFLCHLSHCILLVNASVFCYHLVRVHRYRKSW